MRAINVLLAMLVSLALALLVLEGGLRLLGFGPKPTINRFDAELGWVKTPGVTARRSSSEFDVTYAINQLGLRDDPMKDPGKPTGTCRVLFLGDSFVLGYTVDREDLFVDVLERWWKAEGRPVECVNAGTEGWSTDQEVLWFQKYGRDFAPDLVVLCPYENDLYWNGQTSYFRFPKPRFTPEGTLEKRLLLDPGPESAAKRWAIGNLLAPRLPEPEWSPDGKTKVRAEWSCYFHATPDVMADAYARTKGALQALKQEVEGRGARLIVAPIPNKACVEPDAREALVAQVAKTDWLSRLRRKVRGQDEPAALAPDRWSPEEPVARVAELCKALDIETIDALGPLKAAASDGTSLYYRSDWHFNPAGNRAFARILKDELERRGAFPAAFAAKQPAPMPPPKPAPFLRGWMLTFAALWLVLAVVYRLTYPKDALWKGPAITGGMLALVFTIALGGGWVLGRLPPGMGQLVGVLLVVALLCFLLIKLGRRLGTVFELLWAFTLRGHWYLMPLVVVLLTVGSLLVVAASSPLVAPFIYTLF
jgi:lysophospholipase L1-like esterase